MSALRSVAFAVVVYLMLRAIAHTGRSDWWAVAGVIVAHLVFEGLAAAWRDQAVRRELGRRVGR